MDFSELTKTSVTDEQLCRLMYDHPFTAPHVKLILARYKDVAVTGITMSYGELSRRFDAVQVRVINETKHIRDQTANIYGTSDVLIAPASSIAVNVDTQERTNLEYKRGYWTDSNDQYEIMSSVASEMVAYMYTPASKDKLVNPVKNNFRDCNLKHSLPKCSLSAPLPEDWVASDVMKNMRLQQETLTPQTMLPAMDMIIRNMKSVTDEKGLDKISIPVKNVKNTYWNTSKDYIPRVMIPFVPPITSTTDVEQMWRYLQLHRQFRGEDNRWLSQMTAGYYYGVMPKPVELVFWQVADIIHVLRMYNLSIVAFLEEPNSGVSRSLAASGYVVFVKTVKCYSVEVHVDEGGCYLPGVYRVPSTHTVKQALMILPQQSSRPVITGKTMSYPKETASMVKIYASKAYPTMAWVFLDDVIDQFSNVKLQPSLHAHAGHAILLMGPMIASIEGVSKTTLMDRCSASNCFKTWFPFTRTRFLEFDLHRYKFVNLAIKGTFTIRMRELSKVRKTDEYGTIDSTDFTPYLDKLENKSVTSYYTEVYDVKPVSTPLVQANIGVVTPTTIDATATVMHGTTPTTMATVMTHAGDGTLTTTTTTVSTNFIIEEDNVNNVTSDIPADNYADLDFGVSTFN